MKVWRCFALKTSYFVMHVSNITYFVIVLHICLKIARTSIWKSFWKSFCKSFWKSCESLFESHLKVLLKVHLKVHLKVLLKVLRAPPVAPHAPRPTRRALTLIGEGRALGIYVYIRVRAPERLISFLSALGRGARRRRRVLCLCVCLCVCLSGGWVAGGPAATHPQRKP